MGARKHAAMQKRYHPLLNVSPFAVPSVIQSGVQAVIFLKRDRKPAQGQKTHRKEVGTIGFEVWDNKIRVLGSMRKRLPTFCT